MAFLNSIEQVHVLFQLLIPSIHAKNYHCILLVTKSNNVMRTLMQAKLSNRPLGAKILGQHSCMFKANLVPKPKRRQTYFVKSKQKTFLLIFIVSTHLPNVVDQELFLPNKHN